ncbi:PLP-dependent aminotransferase family protein [Bacillus gaemokensis]|uniref:Transcriptional regulator n=1 Tax=Bacillus gaemokensis TaxID=574375 RepID=A0A073KC70_9BACI|nr:PLP-dependent aminotransferase family protein [Bacillus gaemokensis]KEK24185.1 transcriptional regulator [Bacillus gaemokensis]KYG32672.1 transcriptional regulator [Bacillus gaemokensis]
MDISPKLDENLKESLYIQLYEYIKEEIQSGRISPLTRLPSIRQLSTYLRVSKTTVQMAYQQLLAEGYIESKERSGFYVVEIEREPFGRMANDCQSVPFIEDKNMRKKHIRYDFYMCNIDLDHFPYNKWRTCSNQSMNIDQKELLSYGDQQGELGLRRILCNYLRQARGVNCSEEQIVLGAGTQTVIKLLCQLIGLDRKKVAMEEPGYYGGRNVFHQLGFSIKPIHLQKDGINIEELAKSGAKVAYITPSHQYPLGMVLPIAKRMKLLQWAEENNCLIIEDDYDGEFRYHGKPIPSLQGLDAHGNVVYIGTFSKSLMPAIRISYMVLPKRLLEVYRNNLFMYEQTVSRLHQKSLQLFMESGEWERHIRRMRKVYQKKHDVLLQTIKNVMRGHVKVTGQDAGLHIVIEVKSSKDVDDLVKIAEDSGVKVYSITNNWFEKQVDYPRLILLGFGGLSIQEIEQGIKHLHAAWSPFYKEE